MKSPILSTIAGLYIYPVKSCGGIPLAAAEVTARGLARDREWMVVNPDGQFLTQRDLPRMARIETEINAGTLCLRVPGQSETLELSLADRDQSRCRVRVWNDDCEAYDEGRTAAEWLSDFLGTPARLVRFAPEYRRLSDREWTRGADAENRFSDAFPILVISEESLDELNRRLDVPVPMDRFRPNIILRGLGPHGEDNLDLLSADGCEIRLVKPCKRCSVIGTDQATAEVGKEPLSTLASYRRDEVLQGVTFGMNGIVVSRSGTRLAVGMHLTASKASVP